MESSCQLNMQIDEVGGGIAPLQSLQPLGALIGNWVFDANRHVNLSDWESI